ncbi:Signal transduction histidine kinase [Saccharopolyspora kobensis]|uniref:Oxygen sensor histidine kinase NreB n=3 Tax=Saccharopolyspora kobensis TaxID=146035 RepID=A0A1H6DUX5_9PSEU|nr:sensor histidine kinase [Saccharopolyspora kobensis]SEG88506.1 Signal transduction histidine kinase [Saccharopolyspora kobensis]SFE00520.1 Signal transduction histidine kinase [Saccharopolyspora kobensis]
MTERPGGWLYRAMHVGFFVLLASSASRYVAGHGLQGVTPLLLGLSAALVLIYVAGVVWWERAGQLWLAAVVGVWCALVLVAPSFSWCAVPLFFVCLRLLRPKPMLAAVVLLTGTVIFAQLRLAPRFEVIDVLVPLAVAAMATAVFLQIRHEGERRQQLIDQLVRTRGELAEAQREAGISWERERLAREIHDTIAQGLSSIRMLLQAAEREGDRSEHVRRAGAVAEDSLAEARRFVRGLAPAALTRQSLADALRELVARTAAETGIEVRFEAVGEPLATSEDVDAALLRVAQGALANVREHSGARKAGVTLSYLADAVALDVRDDGTGFDTDAPRSGADRGYGLRGMRARVAQLGGELVVESGPGEGTAIAATFPVGGNS